MVILIIIKSHIPSPYNDASPYKYTHFISSKIKFYSDLIKSLISCVSLLKIETSFDTYQSSPPIANNMVIITPPIILTIFWFAKSSLNSLTFVMKEFSKILVNWRALFSSRPVARYSSYTFSVSMCDIKFSSINNYLSKARKKLADYKECNHAKNDCHIIISTIIKKLFPVYFCENNKTGYSNNKAQDSINCRVTGALSSYGRNQKHFYTKECMNICHKYKEFFKSIHFIFPYLCKLFEISNKIFKMNPNPESIPANKAAVDQSKKLIFRLINSKLYFCANSNRAIFNSFLVTKSLYSLFEKVKLDLDSLASISVFIPPPLLLVKSVFQFLLDSLTQVTYTCNTSKLREYAHGA